MSAEDYDFHRRNQDKSKGDRTKEREEIDKQIEEFLKNGGKIEHGRKPLTKLQCQNLSESEKKAATYMTTVSYGSF